MILRHNDNLALARRARQRSLSNAPKLARDRRGRRGREWAILSACITVVHFGPCLRRASPIHPAVVMWIESTPPTPPAVSRA